jgi:hypothetical protein
VVTVGDGSSRVAGALIGLVALGNLAVAGLSVTTGLVRLSPAATGAFALVGLLTAALAVLVWRANRLATIGAATVFAMLLVFQISELNAPLDPAAADTVTAPVPRLVLLAALVVACGVAAWRQRRTRVEAG